LENQKKKDPGRVEDRMGEGGWNIFLIKKGMEKRQKRNLAGENRRGGGRPWGAFPSKNRFKEGQGKEVQNFV